MSDLINKDALKAINEILRQGNDVKIRRHKNGVVVSEEKQTIKYRTN